MQEERNWIGWRFWVRWVLVTAVGYSVGFFLGFVVGHVLLGNVMFGVTVGAGVGFMQWLTLRRFVQQSGWWVLANMTGLTVAFVLYAIVVSLWEEIPFHLGWPLGVLAWGLALVLGGIFVSLLQQRILRRHAGARSPTGCGVCTPGVMYTGGRSVLRGDAVCRQL